MAWFRLDDAAIYHPKVQALSDGAFRLWIEGGIYCTRHLTDGRITDLAVRAFRSATKARIQELVTVHLWDADAEGRTGDYRMHDYLDWQESRAAVVKRKDAARQRMTRAREHLANISRTPPNGSREHPANSARSSRRVTSTQSDPIRS
jgi:hypothetical protein